MSAHKDEMYSKLAEENARLKARIAELEGVEQTARRLGYVDGFNACIRELAEKGEGQHVKEARDRLRKEIENGHEPYLAMLGEALDDELSRLYSVATAQAAELERLRKFRENAEQVADDIGCEGWDKPGKCKCPGCRICEADWDDDLDRAPAQAEPQVSDKDGAR